MPPKDDALYVHVHAVGGWMDSVYAHTEKDLSSLAGRGTERLAWDYPRGV